jgi:glycogen debranching enzyme
MWRGPVWANINYFFVEALNQIGEYDMAHTLRQRTLELMMSRPGIYEYYNSQTGQPPETAAETFGWSAAVFIDLAIQASRGKGVE